MGDTTMNNYDEKKGYLREKVITAKPTKVYGVNVDELFYKYILKFISYLNHNANLLDVGTGTGIVPRTIYDKMNNVKNINKINIDGIDISEDLINIAKSYDNKSNYYISEDEISTKKYNLITNRLCPRYLLDKISEHLLDGGIYIFKEYDMFRGLKEIKELFPEKWIPREDINYFLNGLNKLGFEYIFIQKFVYHRLYGCEELNNILNSTNILRNYTVDDYEKIKSTFGNEILLTQDPYILIASKKVNIFELL